MVSLQKVPLENKGKNPTEAEIAMQEKTEEKKVSKAVQAMNEKAEKELEEHKHQFLSKEEKKVRIEKEKRKLKKLIKSCSVDNSTLSFLEDTINQIAFLHIFLEELREDILINGYKSFYTNRFGRVLEKEGLSVHIYNLSLRNYTTLIRSLGKYLDLEKDSSSSSEVSDKLAQFLLGKTN